MRRLAEFGSRLGPALALLLAGSACTRSGDESGSEPGDRAGERSRMVERGVAGAFDRVEDEAVLHAMRVVPRHAFVPEARRAEAYDNRPLPIGFGQTISQPYIVGAMTAMLELERGDRVLEIGTGSGYQAAVLAELTDEVFTIEIVPELADRAERTLRSLGYDHVRVRAGDGYHGWPEEAPFDAIIVTAAPPELPEPLWEQLAPGGRIVAPIGERGATQELMLIEKGPDGERRATREMLVRFVPFTRSEQE